MLRMVILVIFVLPIISCQKNSFESCVEYYEKKAKEDYPSGDTWKEVAELNINLICGNNHNSKW